MHANGVGIPQVVLSFIGQLLPFSHSNTFGLITYNIVLCYAIHQMPPLFCPNKGLYFDTINWLQCCIGHTLTWVNNCHILTGNLTIVVLSSNTYLFSTIPHTILIMNTFTSINFENISLLVSGYMDLFANKKCDQVAWTYLDCHFVLRLHGPI